MAVVGLHGHGGRAHRQGDDRARGGVHRQHARVVAAEAVRTHAVSAQPGRETGLLANAQRQFALHGHVRRRGHDLQGHARLFPVERPGRDLRRAGRDGNHLAVRVHRCYGRIAAGIAQRRGAAGAERPRKLQTLVHGQRRTRGLEAQLARGLLHRNLDGRLAAKFTFDAHGGAAHRPRAHLAAGGDLRNARVLDAEAQSVRLAVGKAHVQRALLAQTQHQLRLSHQQVGNLGNHRLELRRLLHQGMCERLDALQTVQGQRRILRKEANRLVRQARLHKAHNFLLLHRAQRRRVQPAQSLLRAVVKGALQTVRAGGGSAAERIHHAAVENHLRLCIGRIAQIAGCAPEHASVAAHKVRQLCRARQLRRGFRTRFFGFPGALLGDLSGLLRICAVSGRRFVLGILRVLRRCAAFRRRVPGVLLAFAAFRRALLRSVSVLFVPGSRSGPGIFRARRRCAALRRSARVVLLAFAVLRCALLRSVSAPFVPGDCSGFGIPRARRRRDIRRRLASGCALSATVPGGRLCGRHDRLARRLDGIDRRVALGCSRLLRPNRLRRRNAQKTQTHQQRQQPARSTHVHSPISFAAACGSLPFSLPLLYMKGMQNCNITFTSRRAPARTFGRIKNLSNALTRGRFGDIIEAGMFEFRHISLGGGKAWTTAEEVCRLMACLEACVHRCAAEFSLFLTADA